MEKYKLRGELQLRTVPRDQATMRVAVVEGNYIDNLDVWLQRKNLIGKTVELTVKVCER